MREDWWSSDPKFPVEDWQYEVANDNTRLGYWEWVDRKYEELDKEEA